MIVVADSGSTKTDWRFVDENGKVVHEQRTMGFNPYFHIAEFISKKLDESFEEVESLVDQVTQVYFYGAGCSSFDLCDVIHRGLKQVFNGAVIKVEHDLLGACRALFGNEPGFACIIGTGSNSCAWDGNEIIYNKPSHGYILGDEGSGAHLGMQLLRMYFRGDMPESVRESFEETFSPDEAEIITNVYKRKNPNVYLASFAKFFSDHKEDVTLGGVVYKALYDFVQHRIVNYKDYKDYNVGFVGSIAFHFEDSLNRILSHHGKKVDRIVTNPVDELVRYHLEQVAQS